MCAGDLTAYDVLINVTQQIAMFAPFLPSHALKPEKQSNFKYFKKATQL